MTEPLTVLLSPLLFVLRLLTDAPNVHSYAWIEDLADGSHQVHIQLWNRGRSDVTVDIKEIYGHYAYDDKPWHDIKDEEKVDWEGPELPYRLQARSSRQRWVAWTTEASAPAPNGASAVLVEVAGRPRQVFVREKPATDWKLTGRM